MSELRGFRKDDWVRFKTPEPGEGECNYRIDGFRIRAGRLEIKPASSEREWVPASEVWVCERDGRDFNSGDEVTETELRGDDMEQFIIEAATVRRAPIGVYPVMVFATMCTNREDRPTLRQVFMTPDVARKLAADIQTQFGK